MGGELKVPSAPARCCIERYDRRGKQIVPYANLPIQIGTRVADAPVQCVGFRIIGPRHPGRTATLFPAVTCPCLVTKLSRAWNCIKPPQPLPCGRIVRINKAANSEFAPRNAGDNLVL